MCSSASILTVFDPDQYAGYVKVDDVINYWQSIGIETPHEQSLENILTEVSGAILCRIIMMHQTQSLPADPSGRINVGELTATLEASIVTEGESQNGTLNHRLFVLLM